MPLNMRFAGLIRALIYPVQFDHDPRDGIDRVLEMVVEPGGLDGTPAEYLAAIRAALASSERLSDLIPQDHPEEVVRQYLAEVAQRIENRKRTQTG